MRRSFSISEMTVEGAVAVTAMIGTVGKREWSSDEEKRKKRSVELKRRE